MSTVAYSLGFYDQISVFDVGVKAYDTAADVNPAKEHGNYTVLYQP
jgi:hypothetical protein